MKGFRRTLAAWLLMASITTRIVEASSSATDVRLLLRRSAMMSGSGSSTGIKRLQSTTTINTAEYNDISIIDGIENLESNRRLYEYGYYGYDNYGKGKGKGSSSKSKGKGKGKGGSKGSKGAKGNGSKGSKGKGDEGNVLPKICEKLNFLPTTYVGGSRGRDLQFDGELCDPNVLETAAHFSDISIFVDLMERAGLDPIFLCAGPFTVLAPNNRAFERSPSLTAYLADPRNVEKLQQVLLYHIVPGLVLTSELEEGTLATLQGSSVDVRLNPIRFNQALLEVADILACNGAIDIIDDILLPPGIGVLPDICKDLDFRPGVSGDMFNSWLPANDHPDDGPLCQPNVLDALAACPSTSTFLQLLETAGLSEIFVCAGPFTVLAPTNDAIAALDGSVFNDLLKFENRQQLRDLLLYHILPGRYLSDEFEIGSYETLLPDASVFVTGIDPVVFNNRMQIVDADKKACNGVVQIIDDILIPEPVICEDYTFDPNFSRNCTTNILEVARNISELSLAVSLIDRAGIAAIFTCPGPFTALLPTNTAFQSVDPALLEVLLLPENQDQLADFLFYHFLPGAFKTTDLPPGPVETLLPGESITVSNNPIRFNGVGVISADINGCNGYINILESVLLPLKPTTAPAQTLPPVFAPVVPPTVPPTSAPTRFCSRFEFEGPSDGEGCDPNILDVARQRPELSLAVIMFERAGLAEIFDCRGPMTVQFPTNNAIENVDAAQIDFLLRPENIGALQNLMFYHILPGYYPSSDIQPGRYETLFNLRDVEVSLNPYRFNTAEVIEPDIGACNGLINIIDEVLSPLPPRPSAAPTRVPTKAPVLTPTMPPVTPPVLPPSIPTASPTNATIPVGPPVLPPVLPPVTGPTVAPLTVAPGSPPTLGPNVTTPAPVTTLPVGPPVLPPVLPPVTGPTAAPSTGNTTAPTGIPVIPPIAGPTTTPTTNPTVPPGTPTVTPTVTNFTTIPDTLSPSGPPVVTSVPVPTVSPSGNATEAPTPAGATGAPIATPGSAVPTPASNGTAAPTPASNGTAAPTPASNGTLAPTSASTVRFTVAPTASNNNETEAPSASPNITTDLLSVRVADFYMAYVAPDATNPPTDEEYQQVVDNTVEYFAGTFSDTPGFVEITPSLRTTKWDTGFPEERFNIYMEYEYMDILFEPGSSLPTSDEALEQMRVAVSPDYILNFVRPVNGTFSTVNEVVLRALEAQQRSGDSQKSVPVASVAAASGAALVFALACFMLYRRRMSPKNDMDGIYAYDSKVIENYFSERSVTENSESLSNSRFAPLPMVEEERNEEMDDLRGSQ